MLLVYQPNYLSFHWRRLLSLVADFYWIVQLNHHTEDDMVRSSTCTSIKSYNSFYRFDWKFVIWFVINCAIGWLYRWISLIRFYWWWIRYCLFNIIVSWLYLGFFCELQFVLIIVIIIWVACAAIPSHVIFSIAVITAY